jgi:oligo-1,6-glucosidase
MESSVEKVWWKELVFYQVYPRSFKDGNGDGIGDLPGLIEKLDHIKDLGVDMIWLSPMYKSPNDDNGYDVSDYYDILDEFGSMADFDRLMEELEKRDLKLMLDLVINHSSDEHQWFQEARSSRDNPYHDYYIWREPKNGKPPNNWKSFFGGSAWEWNEQTQEYYLHLFTRKQPDLNWENEALRREIYKMMSFWLDKGVKGFRMDVIPFISKDLTFPDYPEGFDGNFVPIYAHGPRVHEFLKEMNREVLSKYDVVALGEGIGVTTEDVLLYIGRNRKELDMAYHFEHMTLDRKPGNFFGPTDWSLAEMKDIFIKWDQVLSVDGWNSIFLGNHDFPRLVSRFGNDKEYHAQSAKLYATLLLSLRGSPFIYQGDEIGMTNSNFSSIDEYRDVQTMNAYNEFMEKGGSEKEFLEAQLRVSRDHARTPVQWNDTKYAGFSESTSWIRVTDNYKEINVAQQMKDSASILNYYRRMIEIRKHSEALVYGDMRVLDGGNSQVFAYERVLEQEKKLVILNISNESATVKLGEDLMSFQAEAIITNYPVEEKLEEYVDLKPWEARVYNLST